MFQKWTLMRDAELMRQLTKRSETFMIVLRLTNPIQIILGAHPAAYPGANEIFFPPQ